MSLIGNTFSKYIYYPTYNRLDGLLVGILIAMLIEFRPYVKNIILSKSNGLFFIGIVILTSSFLLFPNHFLLVQQFSVIL